MGTGLLLGAASIIAQVLSKIYPQLSIAASLLAPLGGGLLIFTKFVHHAAEEHKRSEKIAKVERRFEAHPDEPKAAWDLARVKLEAYLDRNLAQVRSIFLLTAVVMTIGFLIIIAGVVQVYSDPTRLKASILATCSGLVVNIVGATFLVVYKSTMEQTKDYVTIIERINAVGMTVQVLDSLKKLDADLYKKATADLASQLLSMYSTAAKRTSQRG